MLCHECSKGWFDKFIDHVSFLDVSLVLFLGIFLAPFVYAFFLTYIFRAMIFLRQRMCWKDTLRHTKVCDQQTDF